MTALRVLQGALCRNTHLALAFSALLAGCSAPSTRVVLLPQEGRATAVTVTPRADGGAAAEKRMATLDKPYATASVRGMRESIETGQTDAQALNERYAGLLAAWPMPPERFTLYFRPGTSELTEESASELDIVLQRAEANAGREIIITGHTDRVGSLQSNDQLSLQRAFAIRDRLLQRGFDSARLEAVGRGEREPIVSTDDGVAEPRNRRVEILVR